MCRPAICKPNTSVLIAEYADQELDMARLCIAAWDIPGLCDVRAMSYVINAHLRRHDTYRNWFEYTDDDRIVRRTIPNARGHRVRPHPTRSRCPRLTCGARYWPHRARWSGTAFGSC